LKTENPHLASPRTLPIKTTDEFGAYARRIYGSLGFAPSSVKGAQFDCCHGRCFSAQNEPFHRDYFLSYNCWLLAEVGRFAVMVIA
jgi:hypothetical protein